MTEIQNGVTRTLTTAQVDRWGSTDLTVRGLPVGRHALVVAYAPKQGSTYAGSSSRVLVVQILGWGRDGDSHSAVMIA